MTYEELKECKCLYCGIELKQKYYVVWDLTEHKELRFCSDYCFEEYKRIYEYLTKLKGE